MAKRFQITRESVEISYKTDPRFQKECIRCGKPMDAHPAMSRYASVRICSKCGMEEALSGFCGYENNFNEWNLGR